MKASVLKNPRPPLVKSNQTHHHDDIHPAIFQQRYVNALVHPHDQPLTQQQFSINMAISHSPYLRLAASTGAAIAIGIGINAILRPDHALTFFEWEAPTSPSAKKLVRNLLLIYGVRDIFMGVVINIAAYFGDRKTLGWTLIASAGCAFADGLICWNEGKGHWNHWGYVPMLIANGCLLLGILDRAK